MRKMLVLVMISICFLVTPVFAGAVKEVPLPEVLKPEDLTVDDSQLYVIEGTTIHIYSTKDFKLKKTFGRHGEGPGEFNGFARITPHPDYLLVNSRGKILFFSRDGEYRKEMRPKAAFNRNFQPLDQGFIGRSRAKEGKIIYQTVNLFDADLNRGKELFRRLLPLRKSGKIRLLDRPFFFLTHNNKIFIAGKEGFRIDAMDHTGKLLCSVKQEYTPLPFTSEIEKRIRDTMKKRGEVEYARFKDRIVFPPQLPEIRQFYVSGDRMYACTWKEQEGKAEFFVYDISGKLVKQVYVPFSSESPLDPFPAAVHKGQFYQLVEDEEEETWVLRIFPI